MSKLRQMIRELIQAELEEISATGNVAGYQTPYAFAGQSKQGRAHRNKIAQQAGYTLAHNANDGETDQPLAEGVSRYQGFKNDPSLSEAQKIGRSIQEIHRQLAEMHRVVRMASRLKTETQTPQTKLWKRTAKHVSKMEERLEEIRACLQDLRS
jgi:Mg2+ and Co2+ transporter CorA